MAAGFPLAPTAGAGAGVDIDEVPAEGTAMDEVGCA